MEGGNPQLVHGLKGPTIPPYEQHYHPVWCQELWNLHIHTAFHLTSSVHDILNYAGRGTEYLKDNVLSQITFGLSKLQWLMERLQQIFESL